MVERPGVEQPGAEFWQYLHWLGQRHAEGREGTMHVLTKRALQSVSESPELGLDEVARAARACASEVSRYFHRDVGMTFVRYRTRLRLLRFMNLVDECRGDLRSAAIAAGFGSYSQCHRTFQSELGCAPRAFFTTHLRQQMQRIYDDETLS